MFVTCIHIQVKPEQREAFLAIALENARHTVQEPGNLRFDVLQEAEDPHRFLLYEVYRDEEALKTHKTTAHYARWAEAVPPCLAEPRSAVRYTPWFPERAEQWATHAPGLS